MLRPIGCHPMSGFSATLLSMRASRLLSLLMLLQSRGRMSAQSLSEELEVSVRTVYRDVDELSAAGVPVWAEHGRNGGFRLQEGWRTRVDGLTAREAQAMFLGGLPGPAAQLGLGEAMASAQLKLLAALPADWRDDAHRVSSRFHLDPIDWYRGPAATDHLPAVAQAVWSERRIAVRYESWKGVVERTLEPLGLVLKAGNWYLAATAGKEPRTYRLSNVLELKVTDEAFARPKAFDLAAYWGASTKRFESELYRDRAVVRASPRGWKMLRQLSAAVADAMDRAPDEKIRGWRQVTIPIESIDHAAGQLLRMGAEVQVIEPAALRRKVTDTIAAMAALYS
jgi:predicted DNA-binding transcriptional regulator YafY